MMLVFDEISGALKAFSRSRSEKQFPGALQKTEKINSGAQIPRFSIQERYNFYPPCFFLKIFNLIAGTDLMYQTASALCPPQSQLCGCKISEVSVSFKQNPLKFFHDCLCKVVRRRFGFA